MTDKHSIFRSQINGLTKKDMRNASFSCHSCDLQIVFACVIYWLAYKAIIVFAQSWMGDLLVCL
jgi:hypothetical protein